MRHATAHDVGDRKREQDGINEDSVAVVTVEDGHREGFDPVYADLDDADPTVSGPGDPPTGDGQATEGEDTETEVYPDEADGRRHRADRTREAGVFVLADGAGGMSAGDVASYVATQVVAQEVSYHLQDVQFTRPEGFGIDVPALSSDRPDDEAMESAIVEAVAEAGRAITKYARATDTDGVYTTVVVGVYHGDRLHYGWLGDSRAYVVNEVHEEIARLTRDHAKVTRLEEEDQIDAVEAHVHPDGNEITRALGASSTDDPETVAERTREQVETDTVPLFREDVVLLTSDGLVDAQTDHFELYREYVGSGRDEEVGQRVLDAVVTDDEIRDVVLETESPSAAADRYVALSNERGGKDNVSVVLFEDDTLPASPPPEGRLPVRAADPDADLEERGTVVRSSGEESED